MKLRAVLLVCWVAIPAWAVLSSPEQAAQIRQDIEVDAWAVSQPAEKIVLPVSEPQSQGQTGLCWIYATLSALETHFLALHPERHPSLSRPAMQYFNWEDRYLRWIDGVEDYRYEGGTTIDAIALIRRRGLTASEDYAALPKSVPWLNPFDVTGAGAEEKKQSLYALLDAAFGRPPTETHFAGNVLAVGALADLILGEGAWEAYRPADEAEGYGDHWDRDARHDTQRPENSTHAWHLRPTAFLDTIRRSLQAGFAPVISLAGGVGHSVLLYGAEYDADGKPQLYYIKDSNQPYFYTADPQRLHPILRGLTTTRLPAR